MDETYPATFAGFTNGLEALVITITSPVCRAVCPQGFPEYALPSLWLITVILPITMEVSGAVCVTRSQAVADIGTAVPERIRPVFRIRAST